MLAAEPAYQAAAAQLCSVLEALRQLPDAPTGGPLKIILFGFIPRTSTSFISNVYTQASPVRWFLPWMDPILQLLAVEFNWAAQL